MTETTIIMHLQRLKGLKDKKNAIKGQMSQVDKEISRTNKLIEAEINKMDEWK